MQQAAKLGHEYSYLGRTASQVINIMTRHCLCGQANGIEFTDHKRCDHFVAKEPFNNRL